MQQRPKQPAWDPSANPVRLRCGLRVYGWVYPDSTVEIVCRERSCKRPGQETRHLFNPQTGEMFSVFVDKPHQ